MSAGLPMEGPRGAVIRPTLAFVGGVVGRTLSLNPGILVPPQHPPKCLPNNVKRGEKGISGDTVETRQKRAVSVE